MGRKLFISGNTSWRQEAYFVLEVLKALCPVRLSPGVGKSSCLGGDNMVPVLRLCPPPLSLLIKCLHMLKPWYCVANELVLGGFFFH